MTIDFTSNQRQSEFIETCLNCAEGNSPYRYICFGGGIRGGKTFAVLGVLLIFCKMYPKSKWVIYRQDMPSLTSTTIPSLEKIIGDNKNWKWNRDKSNYHVTYIPNNSTIYFYGQNIEQDPELNSMLGLECNGIVFEQAEELKEKLFQMAQSRVGSWIIERMPKPLILFTLNPSQTWVKKLFYEPWQKGELSPPYKFIQSLPNDNPHVTDEQWATWNRMADRYKKQFIEGDWSDLSDKNSLWAFAFDYKRHVAQSLDPAVWDGNRNEHLYLSFDFNRNPITCSVIQHYEGIVFILEQIKLENSDIYQLCAYIRNNWGEYLYVVTGDASGKNSTALVRDNLNFYKVIAEELRLSERQFKIPSVNPPLAENQVLVNSLLQHYNILIHPDKGKHLIYDMQNVRMYPDGSIIKSDRTDASQQADALDCFRYYINTFHKGFLRIKENSNLATPTNQEDYQE